MAVKAKPEGYHTVTPVVVVAGAAKLIDFAKQAFGAEEMMRAPGPGGAIMHAEIKVGDSIIMLSDPMRGESMTASLYLYVDNADAVFKRAVAAGATSDMEPTDMFWGDRMGSLKDPFGNHWTVATHKEDVSPEEMGKRMEAFMKQQQG
jgi:PhnB protein